MEGKKKPKGTLNFVEEKGLLSIEKLSEMYSRYIFDKMIK